MDNNKKYTIVNPSAIKNIIGMLIIAAIQVYNLILHKDARDMLFYFIVILLVFCLAVVIISIVMMYLVKPTVIRFDHANIHIRGRVIRADEIKQIMINNDNKQVIGIKPKDKHIVPFYLCFSFMEDQNYEIQDLEIWANEHQVKIKRGFFMRWL